MLRGEDRGFMAALAQLVAGAKRPIVLTSNAHSLPSLIDAPLPTGTSGDGLQLARVRFRSPSAADAAVYASLVAAAEGRRVSPGEVAAACESKSGDVRRALLSAQFAASNPRASILIPRKRVSVMALEEPGLAGAASRLIARVDPRVSAAEATAPAMAVKALRALTRSASLEDRRAEREAEEAAVRRRAEVVADAAAAKAERAMRNEIRIEKGVLGKARRGSPLSHRALDGSWWGCAHCHCEPGRLQLAALNKTLHVNKTLNETLNKTLNRTLNELRRG